jgi:hypothetical protein
MDVRACLLTSPVPQLGGMDGAFPNFGWKTVCQLQPAHGVSSVVQLDWAPAEIPHAVVLMVAAVAGNSDVVYPVQTSLNDGAVAPGSPGVAASMPSGGAAAPTAHGTHIGNIPAELVGSFIGPKGNNVKALCQRHGNCKVIRY